jgi:tetratricopeptide (TPR) repeat protein
LAGRAGILEYDSGCEALGTALESLGRRGEAIAALESCAAERPSFGSGNFRAPFWMRLKVHLADTYRRSGRIDDAVRQEEEVRQLLAVADPDHPLLKRLNQVARR